MSKQFYTYVFAGNLIFGMIWPRGNALPWFLYSQWRDEDFSLVAASAFFERPIDSEVLLGKSTG